MESFLEHHLSDDRCFLCGCPLIKENRSDEHVIPRWLQERHGLWDRRLQLLNGTKIPYRQLVVPCCRRCNNGPLSALEKEVSGLLLGDFHPPTCSQEYRLFQWCSKILYGLLYRELALLADRRDASVGTIVKKEFLQNLLTFHHFLTSVRRPFRFDGFVPYSIFVAEAMIFPSERESFDYIDHVAFGKGDDIQISLVLSLRTGHFAVFCIFQDNGLQKECFQCDPFDRLLGVPLHPLQFLEIACKSAYKHSKLAFSPKYNSFATKDPDSEVVVTPLNGPRGEAWEPWVHQEYANMFCSHARRQGFAVPDPEDFYEGDGLSTYLFDGEGNPRRFPTE